MNFVFRTDASVQIGTGHVMRCLTLADELKRLGHVCTFVCREFQGHLGDLITSKGHNLTLLPVDNYDEPSRGHKLADSYADWFGVSWQQDSNQTKAAISSLEPDWLVVDHYGLDSKWELDLAKSVGNIMVIDDLANRSHHCALLLDQNLGRKASDYDELLPITCKRLIGPEFALLRPEFVQFRERSLKRRQYPQLKRVLISLGGVDQTNVTGEILDALAASKLPVTTELDIILGAEAPYLSEIRQQAAGLPFNATVSVSVKDMAERMCLADLSIGAAGGTSWERCCLGLPAVLVVLAENQLAGATALDTSGAAIKINGREKLRTILPSVLAVVFESGRLERMSEMAADITDGNGTLRAIQAMSEEGRRVQ